MLASRLTLLQQVQDHPLIASILAEEPAAMTILQIAANYPTSHDRWYAYEALKGVTRLFIGYHANSPSLCASRYYEAMITAIDTLLPQEEDGDDTPIAS